MRKNIMGIFDAPCMVIKVVSVRYVTIH